MNKPPDIPAVFISVDLAREPDFTLGPLLVRPSIRRVVCGYREEAVQPRVMQVLVALARAKGGVVSREQLVETCWDGVIVGDDSITHCIAKARQLADRNGARAFEIETIPRVGYRLVLAPATDQATHASPCAMPQTDGPSIAIPAETSIASGPYQAALRRFALPASVLVVVIVAAVVRAFLLAPPSAHDWVVVESHIPFVSTPLTERDPAISPNGSMLAYTAGPDFFWHRSLYLRLLSGGEPLRLVGPPFHVFSPAWSPDGSLIAFNDFVLGKACRIMVVAALGGSPREVGRCRREAFPILAWDGTESGILFSDSPKAGTPNAIYRLDLNGGPIRQITYPIGGLGDDGAQLSPDDKTLAFARFYGAGKSEIRLRDLSSGTERVLVRGGVVRGGGFLGGGWSPDSSTLFVGRVLVGDSSLWAYPVDGGAPQRISVLPAMSLVSSGPGGLIAVELEKSQREIDVAPASPGKPVTILDPDFWGAFSLAYANDGTLAAIAVRSGATSLLVGDKDGALHEVLHLNPGAIGGLCWSPDGDRLAFVERGNHDFQITFADRHGRVLRRLPYRAQVVDWLDWSSDGELIVSSRDTRGWRAYRIDLGGRKKPEALVPYGWMDVGMRRNMLFGMKDGASGIWRIGATPKQLTKWPAQGLTHLWAMSADRIVYADFSKPSTPVFMAVPTAGGEPQPVGYPTSISMGMQIAVNPRTGLVTYVRLQRMDADIGWLRVTRQ